VFNDAVNVFNVRESTIVNVVETHTVFSTSRVQSRLETRVVLSQDYASRK
jgi:hypothetical protein